MKTSPIGKLPKSRNNQSRYDTLHNAIAPHISLSLWHKNIFNAEINIGENPPYFYVDLIASANFLLKNYSLMSNNNINYLIWRSNNSRYFSMGGDIDYFYKCMMDNDKATLYKYAMDAVQVIYHNQFCGKRDYETVAYVEGKALGGGAEFALSADCFVITSQTTMQLPEIRFGSFPGMGAYSFLTRRVGANMANKIIDSHLLMDADFLLNHNIADHIVCNEAQLLDYLNKRIYSNENKRRKTLKNMTKKVNKNELESIVSIWVDDFFTKKINITKMKTMAKIQRRAHYIAKSQKKPHYEIICNSV